MAEPRKTVWCKECNVPVNVAPVDERLRALNRVRELKAEVASLSSSLREARAEIEIDNKLLAERDKILDEFPCPEHGRCVPHVLELLRAAGATTRAEDATP